MTSKFGGIPVPESSVIDPIVKESKFGGIPIEESNAADQPLPGGGTVGNQTFIQQDDPMTLWEKTKHLFDKPEEEAAKAVQALVDSEIFGLSPTQAYENRSGLDRLTQSKSSEGLEREQLGKMVLEFKNNPEWKSLPGEVLGAASGAISGASTFIKAYSASTKASQEEYKKRTTEDYKNNLNSMFKNGELSQEEYDKGLKDADLRIERLTPNSFQKWVETNINEPTFKTSQKILTKMEESTEDFSNDLLPQYVGTFAENPSFRRGFSAMASGVGSMAIAIPISVIAGPKAGAAILSMAEAGPTYKFAIAKGKTPDVAMDLAIKTALATFFLEKFGLEKIIGSSGTKTARFLKGSFAEGSTEITQTVVQNAIKKHGIDDSISYFDQIIEAGIGGLVGGPAAVMFGSNGENPQPVVSEVEKALREDGEGAFKKVSPDVVETFESLKETIPEAIVIGTIEDNEGNVTGFKMADTKTGNTFDVGPTPTEAEIKTGVDSVRTDFQGISDQDIEKIMSVQESDLETEIDNIISRIEGEQVGTKAQAFKEQVSSIVGEEKATAVTTLLDARAKAAGMTTDEYIDSRGIDVEVGGESQFTEGQTYDQQGEIVTESKNFKNWFGDSQVVDEAGEPLVVYHGTGAEFDEFKQGQNSAFESRGFYFSPHKQVGENYAGKGVVKEVHLNLQNIYEAQSYLEIGKLSLDRIAELKEQGFDGAHFKPKDSKLSFQEEYVAFNPTQIKSVNNRGTFDPADPNIFKQETKASVTFEDTKTIIRAFETADVSSLVHELGHVFRRDLAAEDLAIAETWAGVKDGKWTVNAEEKFARAFEKYLADGKAPIKELKAIFEQFKRWLAEIYSGIKGSSIDVNITPEIQGVFDRLLTESESANQTDGINVLNQNEEQINSKAFKKWFGDSKVIDENGRPLVVYHGSKDVFSVFDASKIGQQGRSEGAGFYFTNDKKIADGYAGETGNLIAAYLSLKKPMPYNQKSFSKPILTKIIKKVAEIESVETEMGIGDGFLSNYGDVNYEGLSSVIKGAVDLISSDDLAIDQMGGIVGSGVDPVIVNKAVFEVTKFDGVISNGFSNKGGSKIFTAFFPEQIKSTGNQGTFDPNDPNILNQKAEPVKTRVRKATGQVRGTEKTVSEREALKASFIKAAQAARKAMSEGNKEGLAKERIRMREIINNATKKRAIAKTVREIKARIKRELKFSKVKKQSGKPVGKFTPEIQDILNKLISASKLTRDEAEQRIVDNLMKYSDELPPQDIVIENHFLEMVARHEGMNDPKQLQSILDEIVALKNEGRLIKNLKDFNRSSRNISRVETTVDELGGIPDGVSTIGKKDFLPKTRMQKAKQALKTIGKSIVGWDDLMDILSSKSKTKPGESFISKDNDLLGYKNKEKRGIRVAMDSVNKIYKKAYGIETGRQVLNSLHEDNATEITLKKVNLTSPIDGTSFEMDLVFTKSELRKRAMELSDPSLEDSFKEMGYNNSTKAAIFNELSGQDKEFIKNQMAFYKKYYAGVNDVYKAMYGVNLPNNEFYTPISREGISKPEDAGIGEFMKEVSFRAAAISGSLKSRVGSVLTVSKQSDVSVLERHISEMEHFKAWAEKIRDMNAVWKDPQVRTSIEINHGSDMLAMIDTFISDIATGSSKSSQKLRGLDKLRINFTKAALAVQPDIMIKQLTSFVAYAEKMPIGQFTKNMALFWTDPVKHYKEIMSSELMKERGKNIDRDLKQAMNSREHSAFSKTRSFTDMLMLNVQVGDQGAIVAGGWPYYKWLKDQGMSHEEALNKFEKFTEQTQQSGDITEQSYWQRGGSLAKLLTMFSSSPNQYLRKEIGAVRNFANGRQGVKQTLKTLAIYHLVLPMFFQFASDRFTWDEEEQKRALIFGSLNGWFIMGDGIDYILRKALGMRAFSMEIPVYSIFHDFVKATDIINFLDLSADEFFRAIRAVGGVAGSFTGLPFKQAIDTTKGAVDVLDGEYEKGLTEMMGYSPYLAEKLSKD